MFKSIIKYFTRCVITSKNQLNSQEIYTAQDVRLILSKMENKFLLSMNQIQSNENNQTIKMKKQLKIKNKMLNQIKGQYEKDKKKWDNQREQMNNEIYKKNNKINQLLRHQSTRQQSSTPSLKKPQKIHRKFSQGYTQCDIQQQRFEQFRQQNEKQNILLTQRIKYLQDKLEEKEEDLEAAKILIGKLVEEVNVENEVDSDDDIESSFSSSSSSSCQQYEQQQQQQIQQQQIHQQPQQYKQSSEPSSTTIQEIIITPLQLQADLSSNCSNLDQDCSTLDGGSCSSNNDFALPEWLQFDNDNEQHNGINMNTGLTIQDCNEEEQYEDKQIWVELIWNRVKYIMGRKC